MTSTAQTSALYTGPAFLSYGFRPFFLLGSFWAAIAIPIWILTYISDRSPFDTNIAWHAHEMLFGYGSAIIAGFLLTAVPNWTGRLPIRGARLAALAGLWGSGRLALLINIGPVWMAPFIDSLFLLSLSGLIWREVIAGKTRRNFKVAGLVTLLAIANIGFHFAQNEGVLLPAIWMRVGMAGLLCLIVLIGGRITPTFTSNWLKKRDAQGLRVPSRFDISSLVITGIALCDWILFPEAVHSGIIIVVAGLLTLARLSRWRFWQALSEPLVFILHIGYAWAAIALILIGLNILAPATFPRLASIHAVGTGAIGVMTLAVMTRASLGHTGQGLKAGTGTRLLFICINLAALIRVTTPFLGVDHQALITLSAAIFWFLSFFGFCVFYGPALLRPKRG